jgi:hypothetical protein
VLYTGTYIEPVGEWSSRDLFLQTILWQILGVLVMVCHVVLVRLSLAFYPLMIILMTVLYARASLVGLLILFQVTLYQNTVISLFTTDMSYMAFTALQGTNFVLMVAMAGIAFLRLWRLIEHRPIMLSVAFALVVVLVYTAIGAAKSGPTSALIYFREFAGPILCGVIGMEVGRIWGYRTVGRCFLYGAAISVALSVFEYCYPIDYYEIVGAVRYLQMKFHSQPQMDIYFSPEDVLKGSTSVFFNITNATDNEFAMKSFRVGGSIMNPISNAYIFAILTLIALSLRRYLWLIVFAPMLLFMGVKGAAILVLTSLALYLVWAILRSRKILYVAGAILSISYVLIGVHIGLKNGDFHVLGFMGGVNSLLHNPIGHGIGVGGNLSAKAAQGFHWTGANGMAAAGADFALESAIGVMIYQMGVGAAAVLGVFATFLWYAVLGLGKAKRSDIIFFAVAMVVLNGVFQEEAFSPYAAGLVMILAGVLIGNWRRPGHVLTASTTISPPNHWRIA